MYGVLPYYAAKIIGDLPVFIVIPLEITLIVYYGVGFTMTWAKYFKFMLSLFCEIQCACAFGYFISCSIPDPSTAAMVAPLLGMPILVSGGFFVNSD